MESDNLTKGNFKKRLPRRRMIKRSRKCNNWKGFFKKGNKFTPIRGTVVDSSSETSVKHDFVKDVPSTSNGIGAGTGGRFQLCVCIFSVPFACTRTKF